MKTDKRYPNGVPKIAKGRELSPTVAITPKLLVRLKACASQRALFEEIYKSGISIYRTLAPSDVMNFIAKRFNVRWAFCKLHLTGCIPNTYDTEYICKGSDVCYIEQVELADGGCAIVVKHRTGTIRVIFGPDMEFTHVEHASPDALKYTVPIPLYSNSEYVPLTKKRSKS